MPSIYLLTMAGLLFWIYFLWSRRRFYRLMLKLPGPMGLPLLGVAPEFALKKFRILKLAENFDTYGSTVFTWIGTKPFIFTRDPRIAADMLLSPKCLNRSSHFTKSVSSVIGHGLLTLEESAWNTRRKEMNIAFKTNVLLSFLPIFNSKTDSLVSLIDNFVGQGEQDLLPHLLSWSFGISHETTMGTDIKEESDVTNQAVIDSWLSLMSFIVVCVVFPIFQIKFFLKICGVEKFKEKRLSKIRSLMEQIINKKLSSTKENVLTQSSENIVINRLVELYRKDKISLDDVRGECYSMIITSFETTGITVSHALILLAMFPEHQDKVFHELKEIFPTEEDFEVTHEDLQKMKYLNQVLSETLRLLPAAPLVFREVNDEFSLSNGIQVPKGVALAIDLFSIHRNKDHWGPEANNFNPDNFLPENIRGRDPFSFIPFSKGQRNCIGWKYAQLAQKLALAKILRKYRLSTSFRYEDLSFIDNLTIKLEKSPLLEFHRRSTDS